MTDLRLRRAARAAESGDTEAAARLLLERVRSGRLSRERLELAAYAGHPAARLAHGDAIFGAAAEAGIVNLSAWVSGLSRWGHMVRLRAAVAAARESLNAQTCECGGSGVHEGARCPECRGTGTTPDTNGHHGYFRPHLDAIKAAEAWLERPTQVAREAWRTFSAANTPDDHPLEWSWERPGEIERQIGHAVHFVGSEQPVREAIRAALTRWALDGEA